MTKPTAFYACDQPIIDKLWEEREGLREALETINKIGSSGHRDGALGKCTEMRRKAQQALVNALTVTRTGADCPICGVPTEIGEKEFCPNVGCPGPGGME